MVGALCRYVATPQKGFQPMKANFGLLSPLAQRVRKKRMRHIKLAERSAHDLASYLDTRPES
jgi:methylenetetrahydrofolate--tRNA-(uracil-5-)-methyltransferase